MEGSEIVNTVVSITGGTNMTVWKTGGGKVTMLKVNSGYGTGGSYANSLMTWDAATWTAVSQADTKVKFELCGEANARYRLIADESGRLIAPPAGCIVIVR